MPKPIESYRLPESPCPGCGYVMDAATGINGGESPVPGNLTICIKCASVSKYDEELLLVPVTSEEMSEICDTDPEIWNIITQAISFIKSLKNDK